MVKVIPNAQRELLTNSEVLDIVTQHQNEQKGQAKERRKPLKADEALNTVTLETGNYLKRTPAVKQSTETIHQFVKEIKENSDGSKLFPNEIIQFINLRPTQPVELNLLVEDIEERIEEDNVEKLCEFINNLLPSK